MLNKFPFIILYILLLVFVTACTKQEPIASFSMDKAVVGIGEHVNFTDQSINEPNSWTWTFTGGDPSSSNLQNPTVSYDKSGKYEVSLMVSNQDGSDAITRTNCVTVQLPPPIVAFSADITTLDAGGTVNFTDQSSNEPDEWSWVFTGGTPGESTSRNPSVQYFSPGVYPVALYVANASGSDWITKQGYITVNQAGTDLTFYNSTYTDIAIEINGLEKVIPPDENVTYYDLTGDYVDYYAWTSGQTAEGTQVGYLLSWDNTIALTSSQITRTLLIDNSYYCLFISNNGTESLNPLEVGIMDILNGFTADRTENIVIPNDNEEYRIGYYNSYDATEYNWIQIRAHAPSWYVYWSQGAQFTLPDTSNQSIHLFSEIKKSVATSSWKDPGNPDNYLYPDYAIRLKEP